MARKNQTEKIEILCECVAHLALIVKKILEVGFNSPAEELKQVNEIAACAAGVAQVDAIPSDISISI